MKQRTHVLMIALLLAASPVLAQDTKGKASGSTAQTPAGQQLHKAAGVVKKVDPKAGTATIDHGPVKSLNWPGMTMPFAVKDPALLAKLEVGKKIEFEFERRGTEYIIVRAQSAR